VYQLSVFIHILSAVVWVGGMLFLALVVVPVARSLPAVERAALIGAVGRRFRVVGWACIALLIATGVINLAYRGLTWETFFSAQMLESQFGRVLLLKLALVVVMIVLSAVHDFVIGPQSVRLAESKAPADAEQMVSLRRQASWMARVNAVLALLVVALGVALVRGLPLPL
jgi:uncharacterized membrane protein